jgi:hypothetical protein
VVREQQAAVGMYSDRPQFSAPPFLSLDWPQCRLSWPTTRATKQTQTHFRRPRSSSPASANSIPPASSRTGFHSNTARGRNRETQPLRRPLPFGRRDEHSPADGGRSELSPNGVDRSIEHLLAFTRVTVKEIALAGHFAGQPTPANAEQADGKQIGRQAALED